MNTDRMTQMATFVRIVEAGSLSAAAAQLRTTQPTVSRRLQALERSLEIHLLQRSTHAIKLTDEGARCFERAKALIGEWDALESELRGPKDEPAGSLRVVAPHALGQQQLMPPLAEYLRRHPRMSVEWLLHDRLPDFIGEGIDCAIHVGEVHDPSLIAVKVGEIARIVVGAPSLVGKRTPKAPAELAALPWLALRTFYRDSVVLTHTRTGEVARFPIRPRLSTDGLYALRSGAVLGLGVTLASAWVLADDLNAGRLVHVAPDWQAAPLPLYIVYPPAPFLPPRLRHFVDAMRSAIPQVGPGARKKRASR